LVCRDTSEWRKNTARLRAYHRRKEQQRRQLSVENLRKVQEEASPVQGVSDAVKAEVAAAAAEVLADLRGGGEGEQSSLNLEGKPDPAPPRLGGSSASPPRVRRRHAARKARREARPALGSGGAWSLKHLRGLQEHVHQRTAEEEQQKDEYEEKIQELSAEKEATARRIERLRAERDKVEGEAKEREATKKAAAAEKRKAARAAEKAKRDEEKAKEKAEKARRKREEAVAAIAAEEEASRLAEEEERARLAAEVSQDCRGLLCPQSLFDLGCVSFPKPE